MPPLLSSRLRASATRCSPSVVAFAAAVSRASVSCWFFWRRLSPEPWPRCAVADCRRRQPVPGSPLPLHRCPNRVATARVADRPARRPFARASPGQVVRSAGRRVSVRCRATLQISAAYLDLERCRTQAGRVCLDVAQCRGESEREFVVCNSQRGFHAR